jgi:2'-5' RNA ligase
MKPKYTHFLAVKVNAATVATRIQNTFPRVNSANLHITIMMLAEHEVPGAIETLNAMQLDKFLLQLRGLDHFNNRVLYIPVIDLSSRLLQIRSLFSTCPNDYTPHVTVKRGPFSPQLLQKHKYTEWGEFTVESIELLSRQRVDDAYVSIASKVPQ